MDKHGRTGGKRGSRPERVRGDKRTGSLYCEETHDLRQKESGRTVVGTERVVAATFVFQLANGAQQSGGGLSEGDRDHTRSVVPDAHAGSDFVHQTAPLIAHRSRAVHIATSNGKLPLLHILCPVWTLVHSICINMWEKPES